MSASAGGDRTKARAVDFAVFVSYVFACCSRWRILRVDSFRGFLNCFVFVKGGGTFLYCALILRATRVWVLEFATIVCAYVNFELRGIVEVARDRMFA